MTNRSIVTRLKPSRLILLLALSSACEAPPASSVSIGTGLGQRVFYIPPPAAPLPPASPNFLPCASGWQLSGAYCAPWPVGATACAQGMARFPGTADCERIGSACPAGAWAEGIPATAAVIYVRAGAVAGTGTEAAPFGSIAAAMAAATAGTVIALARGTFAEAVVLKAGVTLWGACVEGTVLTHAVVTGSAGVVTVVGAGTVVRDLRLSGRRPGIFSSSAGASVHLENVEILNAERLGLALTAGAKATARNLVVRETQRDSTTNDLGVGAYVTSGSSLTVTRGVFDRNRTIGLVGDGVGTLIKLDGCAVLGTQSSLATQSFGFGVLAFPGARIDLTSTIVERNQSAGVSASGGIVVATDLLIRSTQPNASDEAGVGLLAEKGGQILCVRCAAVDNQFAAVRAQDPLSSITADDLYAAATRPNKGFGGYGLDVLLGGSLKITRALVEDSLSSGVSARGVGTQLELTDVVVRRVGSEKMTGRYGQGISMGLGSTGLMTRIVVEDVRAAGVLVLDSGATLKVSDLVIRGVTRSDTLENEAGGLLAQSGARVEVKRALLERIEIIAFASTDFGTVITAEDIQISDTRSTAVSGQAGIGLGAQLGGKVEATRVLIEGSRAQGVLSQGGSEIILSDVVVRGTTAPRCVADGKCPMFGGTGFAAVTNASLRLTRFVSDANTSCGLQQGLGGTMDLLQGVFVRNPIGLNIQDADFPLARINEQSLVFLENGQNFDGQKLPLPTFMISPR